MTKEQRRTIVSDTTQNNPESDADRLDSTGAKGKKSAKAKTSRSIQPVTILALIIALAALTGTAYIGWRGLTLENQVSQAIPRIEQADYQLSQQQTRLTRTSRQIIPIQQQSTALEQRGERLLTRVDKLTSQVRSLEGSTRIDWYLAEIEYLLRLANQRLLMTTDIEGAKTLLASADEVLKNLDNYNLFTVREALAEDIAVLNDTPAFDQEGIYLKLQALGQQVMSLPLLDADRFNVEKSAEPKVISTANDSDWKTMALSGLKRAWQEFSGLFRFTADRTSPVEVLLTPEQEGLIRQNIQLLIEQGKVSLLTRQQVVYQDSLQQATQYLQKYFALAGDHSHSTMAELKSLATINVNPEMPVINRALEALKHIQVQSAQGSQSQQTPEPVGIAPAGDKDSPADSLVQNGGQGE